MARKARMARQYFLTRVARRACLNFKYVGDVGHLEHTTIFGR